MTKELQTTAPQALAELENVSLVFGDIPNDKLIIPRLNLLQSNSTAVTERNQRQGTYHNSVTDVNYGETVSIVPIQVNFGAVLIETEGGMKCRSKDGVTNMFGDKCEECPFGCYYKKWEDGKPPKCSETIDIYALEKDSLQPIVTTFRKTSYKEGQKLTTQMRFQKAAMAITLASDRIKNDKGSFHVIKVKGMEPMSEEAYAKAVEWKISMKQQSYEAAPDAE